jgi:cell division transport system permease protein
MRWWRVSRIRSCISRTDASIACPGGRAAASAGMARVGRDLPLAGDPSARFLPWAAGAMVFLAALALADALLARDVAARWQADLAGTLTVEIAAQGAGPPEARADEALALLRRTAGIAEAVLVPRARLERLVEPWLGAGAHVAELPLPLLIEVRLAPEARLDLGQLGERLAQEVPGARLDDHALWLAGVAAVVRAVEAVALAVVVLVAALSAAAVGFAVRTGLAIHHDVVEVLHLIGARDSYIARQFARHAFFAALKGGVIGLAAAVGVIAALAGGRDALGPLPLPEARLGLFAWTAVAAVPIAAGGVALLAALATVHAQLKRML